jgi:tetratricopeptide (TPR) repeat protein
MGIVCLTTVAAIALPLAGILSAAETAASPANPLQDSICKGDACDQKLQAKEALQFYLPVEKAEPNNVHVLVCIARQYRHLMTDASSKSDKLKLASMAMDYSKRAAAVGTTDSDAQLSPAITFGKMMALLGKRDQIEASKKIKEAAERALKLDPNNDLAWHVLGRWHQVIADVGTVTRTLGSLIYGSLPTSTNENAVNCFEKAIAINPNRLMHYIELGRTYAQMGRDEDAKRMIKKGLAMPCKDKDDPDMKKKGRETLASLH